MKTYRIVYGHFSTGDTSDFEVYVELWHEKYKSPKEAKLEIDRFCGEIVEDVVSGYDPEDAKDIRMMFHIDKSDRKVVMTFDDSEYRTFKIVEEEV